MEDEYESLGLRQLKRTRYRILESSSLSKPKRSVQRKFNLESGPILEDDEQLDPEWEPEATQEEEEEEEAAVEASSSETESSAGSDDSDFVDERRSARRRRKKVKRIRDLSSDEESVDNYDVHYDSGDEVVRRASSKRAKRKKIVSESDDESPVKKRRKPTRVVNAIDSDDELPELVPYQPDPVFLPSPSHSPFSDSPAETHKASPDRPLKLPSGLAAAINDRAFSLSSEISKNVDALRKICPSLQPVVLLKRLSKKRIEKYSRGKSGKSSSKKKSKRKDKVPTPTPAASASPPPGSSEEIEVPPNIEYDLEFFTNDQLWTELERRQKFSTCICGMTFIDQKFYSLHHDMHDKENPKKCAICSEEFTDWAKFTSHTYSSHKTI